MFASLATLWLIHVAAMMTPGANVLLVSQLSASGSARSAAFAAIGVAVGAAIWCTGVLLGLNALFALFPSLRLTMQIGGALYLLYLAARVWRSGAAPLARKDAPGALRSIGLGVFTNLSNPKSVLFFGSIFSITMPPNPGLPMLLAGAAVIVTNALLWHLLLAWLFSRRAVQTGYERQRKLLSRATAGLLGVLGASLLAAGARDAAA